MQERRWSAGRQYSDSRPRFAKYRGAGRTLVRRSANADAESRLLAGHRIQEGFPACGGGRRCLAARRSIASSRSLGPRCCVELGIQRNVELLGELLGIERTARKIAAADLQRGDFPQAIVGLDDDLFPGWVFFDIHFAKTDAALLQESFSAPAIGAPSGAVNGYRFHR